jgi:uncharacterized protein YceK
MKKLFMALTIFLLLIGCATTPMTQCEKECDYEAYKVAGTSQNPFLYADVYSRCIQLKCRR